MPGTGAAAAYTNPTTQRHAHRVADFTSLIGTEELTLEREETDALAQEGWNGMQERHRVQQGDCVQGLAELDAGSVDLVFADPPFNIGYDYDAYHDRKDGDEYLAWCRQWGEQIVATIVLKPGATATADELAGYCRVRLARYKVPKVFRFSLDLPRTQSGKLLRRDLEE